MMLKNGKIQFFFIWAGATSSRAMKVIDTWKNCIFSQFLEFFFCSILTTFDPILSMKRIGENSKSMANENQGFTFLTENPLRNFKKNRTNYFKLIETISSFLSITRPPNSYWAKSYSHIKKGQNHENGVSWRKILFLTPWPLS